MVAIVISATSAAFGAGAIRVVAAIAAFTAHITVRCLAAGTRAPLECLLEVHGYIGTVGDVGL